MALEGLKAKAKDPRPFYDACGLYLVGKTQRAFQDQGRGNVRWDPRSTPNRIGVILDLQQGKIPPQRRFEPRPAAIDTGRLRNSIAYRIEGDTVVVGSNLPYASDVQRGATKTVNIDSGTRKALAAWLKSLPKSRKQDMRRAFGFLFHVGSLTVTTPPRPYLVLTPQDKEQISKLAKQYFTGGK